MSGANGAGSSGNTKPKIPRVSASKRWCFTLFDDFAIDETVLGAIAHKWLWQTEVCPETGRDHLQGYIEFKERIRPLNCLAFSGKPSWRACRGTRLENVAYCSKKSTRKDCGTFVNHGFVLPKATTLITYDMLRPWQQTIVDSVADEASVWNRTIHWYWEPVGNTGKTAIVRHLVGTGAALCVGGKTSDALFALGRYIEENGRAPRVVLLNIPRTREGFVCWEGIESILDGVAFSAKYESGQLLFDPPHVVCFANFAPPLSKLSDDRWHVVRVRPLSLTLSIKTPRPPASPRRRSGSPVAGLPPPKKGRYESE